MTTAKKELHNAVLEILAKVLKIGKDQIELESHLQDDLGIDSVDFWDVIAGVDKKYGVKISVPEATTLKTVNDLIGSLEQKLKAVK